MKSLLLNAIYRWSASSASMLAGMLRMAKITEGQVCPRTETHLYRYFGVALLRGPLDVSGFGLASNGGIAGSILHRPERGTGMHF